MAAVIVLLVSSIAGFVLSRALRRSPEPAEPAPERPAPSPRPARNTQRPRRASEPPAARAPRGAHRRGLTPHELQRAILTEILRGVSIDDRGRGRVPSRFRVRLHPDDVELVERNRGWLLPGVVDALDRLAASEGWRHATGTDIRTRPDPGRRPGLPSLETPAETPPTAAPVLVRTDTGEPSPLTGGGRIIGRGDDADIHVADARVSRHHARVDHGPAGWSITDLGSANGTTVAGRALDAHRPAALEPAVEVRLGPVGFEFRPGSPTSVRSLSDRERIELGRRAFPAPGGTP